MTTDEFIKKAIQIHGNRYDYSKVEYVNAKTKICIICPKHGVFYQLPNSHLQGRGCKKCYSEKLSLGTNIFIESSKKIHGDKYDYSKVNYVNNRTKVCIICPEHGEFWQTPDSHLQGKGCYKCSLANRASKRKLSNDEFIEKARLVHGDKYDYSKVDYVNNYTKICIICPKHGEFWQTPSNHLKYNGCPVCNESKLETEIRVFLEKNNINFIQCANKTNFEWLNNQHLDFYLPDYNIAIECQGEQHFRKIGLFGGEKKLKEDINRDIKKYNKCKNNNIKIYYILPNKKVKTEINEIYNRQNTINIQEKNNILNIIKNSYEDKIL